MRLEEWVKKDYAIVYHRTASEDFVGGVVNKGFSPKPMSRYGPGWYFSYDKNDQFGGTMNHYGNHVIQCKVNLPGMIIWDKEAAQSVYGDNFPVPRQIKLICPEAFEVAGPWAEWPGKVFVRKELVHYKDRGFTSGLAENFWSYFGKGGKNDWFMKKIKGMVYTGAKDRHSMVVYDFSDIQMLSIKKDGPNEPWVPIGKIGIPLGKSKGIKTAKYGSTGIE